MVRNEPRKWKPEWVERRLVQSRVAARRRWVAVLLLKEGSWRESF